MHTLTAVFNRLMVIMDKPGETYFSGPRFIRKIQEQNLSCPDYNEYIALRIRTGKSSTRRDFFKDLLKELDEGACFRVVTSILGDVDRYYPEESAEVRVLIGGGVIAPQAAVPSAIWNGNRLNEYLGNVDGAIVAGDYERAITLSYTCMEGFLGAFVRSKYQRATYPTEIIALARETKDYLKATIQEYPDEVLNGITQAAHSIDRARNGFSEAHFANQPGIWMAQYVRDLLNTQIRLLLNFM
jgi:hypothetical protein